MGRLLKS